MSLISSDWSTFVAVRALDGTQWLSRRVSACSLLTQSITSGGKQQCLLIEAFDGSLHPMDDEGFTSSLYIYLELVDLVIGQRSMEQLRR